MNIDIKSPSGTLLLSTPINTGAKGYYSLMQHDYITLPLKLRTSIDFKIGSYADLRGVFDEALGGKLAKMYYVTEKQDPTYNTSTGAYEYQLRLNAYYWLWNNFIFKYTPESTAGEASWSLTAPLDVQLGVFLRNLSELGFTYNGTPYEYSIDSTVENKAVAMTYDNTRLLDALFSMGGENAWNCDVWVTENVIHFGRCEHGDAVKIEIGVEASNMTRNESKGTYATRIYAFGSTRNIPANYRETSNPDLTVNGIVQKRLMLPEDTPYIDAYEDMQSFEVVECVMVNEAIYPRRTGTLSSVTAVDRAIEDGEGNQTGTFKAYQYKDTGLTFDESYIIEGEELRIVFQSGKLNGLDFGVTFNPNNSDPAEQLWEIVANEDYGRRLPDEVMKPENGDTYILYGFNIKLVSDQYIPQAQEELKAWAQGQADRMKIDDGTYTVPLRASYVKADQINRTYDVGQKVNLVNPAFFGTTGRVSRVIGWEMSLDIPYDNPIYTIGESAQYSRLSEIEDKVDSITFNGQTYYGSGGGSGVYVIRTNDSTPASDTNVFSALRSLATFLRKDKDDTAKGLITFLKGINIGEFVSLSGGGTFRVLEDLTTYAEVDRLRVRMKAYFETLEIINTNSVGGKMILTAGGGVYLREVKDRETLEDGTEQVWDYYRCYFLTQQDGREIENRFHVGDLAISQSFNIKAGTHQGVTNHYYWREVVGIGDDYIDLSKSICDTGSDAPMAEDTVCHLGNRTDTDRQGAIIFSAVDVFSPSIMLYYGINDFSMVNKEYVAYGVDRSTGNAFFRVYGEYYAGDREQTTYMKYTPEGGVEIRGKLLTRSGEDVENKLNSFEQLIDGVKETFYGEYTPTTSNYPASSWESESDKESHEGDVFTNISSYVDDETTPDAEKSWQWTKDEESGEWGWTLIEDEYMSRVYLEAARADKAGKEALSDVNSLNASVEDMRDDTDSAFADNTVSADELQTIGESMTAVGDLFGNVEESYSRVYNNGLLAGTDKTNLYLSYTALNTAKDELLNSITGAVSDGSITELEKSDVEGKYEAMQTKYADYLVYLNAANRYIQSAIEHDALYLLDKIGEYDYIKAALKEYTLIEGGLIQSSMLALGYTSPEGFVVMSGTNGVYDDTKLGGGIASWWGGGMFDRFEYTEETMPSNVAAGLVRMDGTGYFANGNLWWESDGTLHADPLSFFVGEETVGDVLGLFQFVKSDAGIEYVIPQYPFQKIEVGNYIQIGNAQLYWDGVNNAFYVRHQDGVTPVGFYATGEVSAYGMGDTTGGGVYVDIIDNLTSSRTDAALSANQGRVLKEMLENVDVDLSAYYTSSQVDSLLSGKSDTNHTHTFSSITSKPSTLSGYGITNAYTMTQVDNLLDDVIDGNVYSATRLQTTRYIWGQPFNGTDDVEGDLTNCTSIRISDTPRTASATATLSNSPMLRITNDSDNYGLYAWVTGADGAGHIQCGREDSSSTLYNLILQELGGNVGIGTKSPSYKLHVEGTARATQLNVNGQSVTSSDVIAWKDLAEVLYFDSSGNLHCDVPFVGDKEVSAYGLGSSSGGGGFEGYDYFDVGEDGTPSSSNRMYVKTSTTNPYYGIYHAQTDTIWYFQVTTSGVCGIGSGIRNSLQIDQSGNVTVVGDLTVNGDINGGGSSVQVINNLTSTSTTAALSANMGRELGNLITTLSAGITQNYYTKSQVDGLIDEIPSVSIVNNLTSSSTTAALSANQGRVLNNKFSSYYTKTQVDDLIDSISGGGSCLWESDTNGVRYNKILIGPTGSVSSLLGSRTNALIKDSSTNALLGFYDSISGANWYVQMDDGKMRVGQGSTTSMQILQNGNVVVYGRVSESSDERLKTDIRPLEYNGMLTPVTFVKDGRREVGFSAQAVREMYPDLVMEDDTPDRYLSLNYSRITAVLQAEILWLKAEIEQLNEQLEQKGGTD